MSKSNSGLFVVKQIHVDYQKMKICRHVIKNQMVTVQISILAINSPNGGGNMGCFGKCGFPWFWGCRRKEKK